MTAVIDYGAGNLTSVLLALKFLGDDPVITGDPALLEQADRIIFPGVGSAASGMEGLKRKRLDEALKKCCTQNNIAVFNVEEYGQTSVAQYTMTLIMALVRNLFPAYLDIQRNFVNHPNYEGRNLNNLTIGIIGCGAIGGAVAKIANFFEMKVLVHSLVKCKDADSFVEYVSLDELLENSDIVSLHIPYSTENYHIIGKNEFAKMKDGSYFINTARGELIDIVALYENLLSGKIKGAALDVLECEYLALSPENIIEEIRDAKTNCVSSALITQKLLGMANVIITPHIAYNTQESINTLLNTTFNNIRDYHKGVRNNQVC